LDPISRAADDGRQQGLKGEPDLKLRIGCDPLHCHLLTPEVSAHLAWHPVARWSELLRCGALDAALVSVAAMARAAGLEDARPASGRSSCPGPSGKRPLRVPGMAVVPLGRRSLVLLHANRQHCAANAEPIRKARQAWQLLLPPAVQQPVLWRQLEQLGLLPLQACKAGDWESLLQQLQAGPHLLPAHLSLLEAVPWLEAGLRAVPAPEPLEESLWLLVRSGEAADQRIKILAANIRSRILQGTGSPP
jgi:hypothetical protein